MSVRVSQYWAGSDSKIKFVISLISPDGVYFQGGKIHYENRAPVIVLSALSLWSYGEIDIGGPNYSRLCKPPEKYQVNNVKLIF